MDSDNKKVSIIIPVYNGINFLREAIDSALAQTYPNIEVIVVNDGSTDAGETERIALSYADKIRYYRKDNGGVATALNLGIEQMEGHYFSWLSHDDLYSQDKISKQVEALEKYGTPAVVYSDCCHITLDGKILETLKVSPKGLKNMRALLSVGQEIAPHGCSLLIPKIFFEKYGKFDPRLRYTQDNELWFRLATHVPFIHVNEVLVCSRQHDQQDSRLLKNLFWRECDLTLSRAIRQLSPVEVFLYVEGSADYLIKIINAYKSIGFEKVTVALMAHIYNLAPEFNDQKQVMKLLDDHIGIKGGVAQACRPSAIRGASASEPVKRKPRLMVYCGGWTYGGAQRVFAAIFEQLKDRYDFFLVTKEEKKGAAGYPLDPGISRIQMNQVSGETISARLAALCMLLKIDMLVGSTNYDNDFLKVYKLLKGLGVRNVACNLGHYFLPYQINGLSSNIVHRNEAYPIADAVTWLTSFSAQIYAQLHPNGVTLPTPNTFTKVDRTAPKENSVVLAVGRFIDAIKRLDRIIEVFSNILRQHHDAKLVVVGSYKLELQASSESSETVGQILRRLDIPAERIHFAGEQEDVAPFYLQASVLILTSETEGIPMVLNEAGSFGLPCVINEISGLEDMITDGENGFIVPQGDLIGMASKVSLLLADRNLRTEMGKRAQELVRRFDTRLICEKWNALFEAVLTIDNKNELHAVFADKFTNPIIDHTAFQTRAIKEYEKNIALLLLFRKRTDQASVPLNPGKPVPPPDAAAYFTQNFIPPSRAVSLFRIVIRPLNWSKRLYLSLRTVGPGITARKLAAKIRTKLKG